MSWSHRKGNTCKGWEKGGKPGRNQGHRSAERVTVESVLGWGGRGERRKVAARREVRGLECQTQTTATNSRMQRPQSCLIPLKHKTSARWPDSDTNQAVDKPNLSYLTTLPPKSKFHFINQSLKGIAVDPTLRSSFLASLFFRQGHRTLKEATQQPRCSQNKWKHIRVRGHRPSFYPTPPLCLPSKNKVYLWVSCSLESSVHNGQLILTYKL